MNAFWTRLDRVITPHGGAVDRHIGDAVMALLGAPTAHADNPESAIWAALDVQKEVHAFAADWAEGQTLTTEAAVAYALQISQKKS